MPLLLLDAPASHNSLNRPTNGALRYAKEYPSARPIGIAPPDNGTMFRGEIDMMLDDGDVHLKAGDVIVQRATNHGWVNRGKEPCRILVVLMDAKDP